MAFNVEQLPTDWVTKDVLMAHLRIKSANTITAYIKQGMPAHRIGKGYLFDLTEVDQWVRCRCITPAPGQEGAA